MDLNSHFAFFLASNQIIAYCRHAIIEKIFTSGVIFMNSRGHIKHRKWSGLLEVAQRIQVEQEAVLLTYVD